MHLLTAVVPRLLPTGYLTAPCLNCRIRYDQTIADVKAAAAEKMGIPVAKQQLFWHKKELTEAYDKMTLLEMNIHTGFTFRGYDLVRDNTAAAVAACLHTKWRSACRSFKTAVGCISAQMTV